MERIVRAGPYFYDVTYRYENETPVLDAIHAFSELVVYKRAKPITFESSDCIKLADAEQLTVDMGGRYPLEKVLLEALQNPKSDPALQAIS